MQMEVDESFMLEMEFMTPYINCTIHVVDEEGNIKNYNKHFLQLLKISKSDLINKNMHLFIPTITLGKEKDYLTIENMECFCYQLPFFDEHDNRQTLILIDDNYHQWAEQIIDKYENALTNLT